MILDMQNLVSDSQDLAKTAAAYLSDHSINLGVAGTFPGIGGSPIADIGRGEEPEILCQVVEAFVGATATVTTELVMADDEALTSNLVSLQSTAAIPVATLTAGYQFRLGIPPGVSKQYLGLRYTIGTATTTAGKITAGLLVDKQTNPTV